MFQKHWSDTFFNSKRKNICLLINKLVTNSVEVSKHLEFFKIKLSIIIKLGIIFALYINERLKHKKYV